MMINEDDIKLYYYSGFENPKKIDIEDVVITSNYLGDITEDFMDLYRDVLDNYTLDDAQENQPLYDYTIWINPTLKQLQEQNVLSYGIPKNTYLDDFEELEQLYRSRI